VLADKRAGHLANKCRNASLTGFNHHQLIGTQEVELSSMDSGGLREIFFFFALCRLQ